MVCVLPDFIGAQQCKNWKHAVEKWATNEQQRITNGNGCAHAKHTSTKHKQIALV